MPRCFSRLKSRRPRGYRRRRPLGWIWRAPVAPLVVIYGLITGREPGTNWTRAYLALGFFLLLATGTALYIDQRAQQEVFAALGRFDPRPEPVTATPYAEEINAAASRYGVNPLAVYSLIQIESGGRPFLISPRGARGLMQIMPQTWQALNPDGPCRGDHGPFICSAGKDCIFAPWGNIRVGTFYFAQLLHQYKGDYVAALQAYNAGQKHVTLSPPAKYAETRKYLASFLGLFRRVQEEQLALGLLLTIRSRRWLIPLFTALAGHFLLGGLFFWRYRSYR